LGTKFNSLSKKIKSNLLREGYFIKVYFFISQLYRNTPLNFSGATFISAPEPDGHSASYELLIVANEKLKFGGLSVLGFTIGWGS
jgi:hypothetical protein